jgi:hypothetical protein
MKTVRDACELQPNALSIKLSDQIEQLDELITAEGDGSAFFGRTSITQGMQDLVTEGTARLAGVSRRRLKRRSRRTHSSSTSTSKRTSIRSAKRRRTCSGLRIRMKPVGPMWPTATPSRPACRGCPPRGSTPSNLSRAIAPSGKTSATATSPRSQRRSAPPSRSSPSPTRTTREWSASA